MTLKEFEKYSLQEVIAAIQDEFDFVFSKEQLCEIAIQYLQDEDYISADNLIHAIVNDETDYYMWDSTMGSMYTPSPINSKEDIEEFFN